MIKQSNPTLVLCIFMLTCPEDKRQLSSQLKSKWPHHLLALGLEQFDVFGDHLLTSSFKLHSSDFVGTNTKNFCLL